LGTVALLYIINRRLLISEINLNRNKMYKAEKMVYSLVSSEIRQRPDVYPYKRTLNSAVFLQEFKVLMKYRAS